MNKTKLQLLADIALNLSPDEADDLIEAGEDYDTPLMARFGIDFTTFCLVINALEPFIDQLEHENTLLKNTVSKLLPKVLQDTPH